MTARSGRGGRQARRSGRPRRWHPVRRPIVVASTVSAVNVAGELGDARPGARSRRGSPSRSSATAASSHRRRSASARTRDAGHDPKFGAAAARRGQLQAVTTRQQHAPRRGRRSASATSFHVTWETHEGVVKVLNPVNIVKPPRRHERPTSPTRPTTVVGITQVSGRRPDRGHHRRAVLLAALNIFVGVFNMFPLLPLDGGHAAIAIYERIRERRRSGALLRRLRQADAVRHGVIVLLVWRC